MKNKDPDEFVHLITAGSKNEAFVIRTVLETAGIRCHIPGEFLQDDFAALSSLTNSVGCAIRVPRKHLESGRLVLADRKDVARLMNDAEEADEPPARSGA